MTPDQFKAFVIQECEYFGIKCILKNTRYLRDGSNIYSGFFDDKSKVLSSSLNRPDWLEILVHEYCHLTQWRDQADVWVRAIELDSYNIFDRWLKGEEIENVDDHIDAIRD